MNKLNKSIVTALFPVILTNPLLALGNIALTPSLVDFGERFINVVKNVSEEPIKTIEVIATAYSSTPDQTDANPFTTAANTTVRDGIIAANFLEFHTQIKIPELYGDKIFIVEDRMNRRYNNSEIPRLDIWMETRVDAKRFGVKKLEIIVLKDN